MNRSKLYKSSNCYSEKSFFKNPPQQQQLASSSYQRTQPLAKFSINPAYNLILVLNLCRNSIIFLFCKKRCKTTINPYSLLMVLQSLQGILFCIRKMILYQIVVRMSTISFDDVVHFIDEGNIVTYVDFDCDITFFPETRTKSDRSTEKGTTFPDPMKNPSAFPAPINRSVICSVDEQHSSNIFVNPYNLWNMFPGAFMWLSHTNDTYSKSNHYPQPTTHQSRTDSYPVFSPLRTMDS